MKKLANSKLRIAMHYRLSISNCAAINCQLPFVKASFLVNRQSLIDSGVVK